MINDITKRWKEAGLLEELNDGQANELAKCLEESAQYLLSLDKKHNKCFASTVIFAVLRRIFNGINKPGKFSFIVNVSDLFWDLNEKWQEFEKKNFELLTNPKYSELFSNPQIDIECEFVRQYCINYLEDLKKRGII